MLFEGISKFSCEIKLAVLFVLIPCLVWFINEFALWHFGLIHSYKTHLNAPSRHSCSSPYVKMIRNPSPAVLVSVKKFNFTPNTKGNSNTTSMSKIKNTTASRKKRIENGKRPDSLGSNPHSNEVIFIRLNK
jgi:hypothetical protein